MIDELNIIENELKKRPVHITKSRQLSGRGRSEAFGVVNKRILQHDYSRFCWLKPLLYKYLLEFGNKYITHEFNAITLNQNYQCSPHRDRGNVGVSTVVAFGNYTGGNLNLLDGNIKGSYDICCKPITANFGNITHSVEPFTGNRYSLVYYSTVKPKIELPPPSVRLYNGKYTFFRGEQPILKKEGLPHPNKKKK